MAYVLLHFKNMCKTDLGSIFNLVSNYELGIVITSVNIVT